MNKHLIIETELAQAILNYLQQRPYSEVFQLIAAMVALKPMSEAEADKPLASAAKGKREAVEPAAA